mgnify:CR=1 FL=1
MNDKLVTITHLKERVDKFLIERDWHQFHSPKTDVMGLSVEAGELMELFLYTQNREQELQVLQNKQEQVKDELADVLTWILIFAQLNDIDLAQAFESKLKKTEAKYPVEKCKGLAKKYTEL